MESYSIMKSETDIENERRGLRHLIGVVILGIFASEYNLLGFLFPYFISYFRIHGQVITIGDMIFLPMIWILTVGPTSPLCLMIKNKIGYKLTLLFYLYFFILVNIICQYITNYKIFCVIYGVSGGILHGTYMTLPTISTWRFFPESKKALLNGIIYSCLAFSPFITSYIAFYSINPNNEFQSVVEILPNGKQAQYFSEEVSHNVPNFFRNFSILAFIFGSLGTLLLSDPVGYTEIKEESIVKEQSELPYNNNNIVISKYNIFLKEIKRIFEFEGISWLFMLMLLTSMYPLIINFVFKSIGLNSLKDDKFVTFCGSFGAIVNGTFRIFAGVLLNKVGFLKFYTALILLEFSFCLLFIPLSYTKITFLIAVVAYEVCYSFFSVFPVIFNKLYKDESAYLFGLSFIFVALGSIISLNLYHLFEKYYSINTLLIIISFISLCAYIPMKKLYSYYSITEKY